MSNAMRWVGIDLQRKRSDVAAVAEQGELTVSAGSSHDRAAFLEPLGIDATTRETEEQAKADHRVDVLTQIRGVRRYTAMLIIAEIRDITRFPTARHVSSWAGLGTQPTQL